MTILYVSATQEEAAHLPAELPLLVTGVGTLKAAIALTRFLATASELPKRVINFGTAGALIDGHSGVFEISHVFQHDFDHLMLQQLTGEEIRNGIDLPCGAEADGRQGETFVQVGELPTAVLATGNSFISDSAVRARLAATAELCDMEGYSIAAVCQEFGVPCTLIKQVSDAADEQASATWAQAVDRGAQELAAVVTQLAQRWL